ncbi:hypothetical protein [Rhodococcus sp. WAY2]|uniref:hypothetical protein n=1 Tax=Rhodococcus sp. WAY2 TaxID=2663121 RepID=UPI00131F4B69|nr:hypothetical protein [Rhodococcus sp. WAY2]QHE72918.1 hypothetical protein GFS60_06567 [Rhodococcus sp. WAY2]
MAEPTWPERDRHSGMPGPSEERNPHLGRARHGPGGLLRLAGLLGLVGLERRNEPTVRTSVGTDPTSRL